MIQISIPDIIGKDSTHAQRHEAFLRALEVGLKYGKQLLMRCGWDCVAIGFPDGKYTKAEENEIETEMAAAAKEGV